MFSLFVSDIKRLQDYYGGSGFLFWIKMYLTRSIWAAFFIRMRGNRLPLLGLFLRPMSAAILFIFFKIELAGQCRIGPGLLLLHPNDLIIGAREIGANATFMNSITLGAKYADPVFTPEKRPRVGCNVTIGVGARVLGGITLGDHSTVGANSVVVKSVPIGAIVAGVPAHTIRQEKI